MEKLMILPQIVRASEVDLIHNDELNLNKLARSLEDNWRQKGDFNILMTFATGSLNNRSLLEEN